MKLVLIPGMGVGERLFEPQRSLPFGFMVPSWTEALPGDTLETYAQRFAESVGPCDAIGGVSFGGMVAQAMAGRVGAKVVIGIATARSGRDIPAALRFAQAVTEAIPVAGPSGASLKKFLGALPERYHSRVTEMIRDARRDVIREGSRMAVAWKGTDPVCPIRLIHGDRDLLIRAVRVKPDRIVKGGGHLINLTHPKAVNAFIMESLAEVGFGTRDA